LGENLKEVHPTVFVGVPRIYEKIIARVQERAAEKGRLNARVVAWAVETGKQWARLIAGHAPVPLWFSIKHRLADVIVLENCERRWRSHSDSCFRRRGALRRCRAGFSRRALADRAGLRTD